MNLPVLIFETLTFVSIMRYFLVLQFRLILRRDKYRYILGGSRRTVYVYKKRRANFGLFL